MLFVVVLGSPLAVAKGPPPTQGRACDAHNKCGDGVQCVAQREGKSRCEVVCVSDAKCPEDQRCVKDGGVRVCRKIRDDAIDYSLPGY